jgi:hypothetical protein
MIQKLLTSFFISMYLLSAHASAYGAVMCWDHAQVVHEDEHCSTLIHLNHDLHEDEHDEHENHSESHSLDRSLLEWHLVQDSDKLPTFKSYEIRHIAPVSMLAYLNDNHIKSIQKIFNFHKLLSYKAIDPIKSIVLLI